MYQGFILLHRKIKEHWIWKSDNRLKWWIDILLSANHKTTKVLIGNTLLECKRGQSIKSLETWAKSWNVSKKTVSDYFKLLQKDYMIELENIQISTRITVCNYDTYNDVVNGKETASKRQVNGKQTASKRELPTNNNDINNNINNDKIIISFFQNEINQNKDKINIDKYQMLVDYFKSEAKVYLKVKKQLTFNQFEILLKKCIEKNIKLYDIVNLAVNTPAYLKRKESVYMTLNNWINNNTEKKKTEQITMSERQKQILLVNELIKKQDNNK